MTRLDREAVGQGSCVSCQWVHILSWSGEEAITNFAPVSQGYGLMISELALAAT